MNNVIITLPWSLWNKIVTGEKKFEIRKHFPKRFDTTSNRCYVVIKGTDYVVGWFLIPHFHSAIFRKNSAYDVANKACVPVDWVFDYLTIGQTYYAWAIEEVHYYSFYLSAKEALKIKSNPQSYVYTDVELYWGKKAIQ